MAYKRIESIGELKRVSKDDPVDCFISLAGGACRSSKSVLYDSDEGVFSILNEIDGTEDVLTEKELYTDSNIGEAIEKCAFYLYL